MRVYPTISYNSLTTIISSIPCQTMCPEQRLTIDTRNNITKQQSKHDALVLTKVHRDQ